MAVATNKNKTGNNSRRAPGQHEQRSQFLTEKDAQFHLAAIVESSNDAILSKNLDGIITSWNAAAERMYGYSAQEIIGQSVTVLFVSDQQQEFTQIMERIRRGDRIDHYETRRVRKDGAVLTVSVTISPVKDSHGTIIGASAIARDITEQKRLEEEYRRVRQELDNRKDEFISMASHELKTPLTSLKGFLSLLQRRLTTHGEESEYYLSRMDTQVTKLIKLINDLLDLSRMQTGKLIYRAERFSIDALVHEIVENVQETTRTHSLHIDGQIRGEVYADRDRIGQVLINLLNNAMKYSPQAEDVLIHVTRDQNTVLIGVQDFGMGIDKEHQQRLFERFYQVTDADAKTYPGLGIGLYICAQIVERHQGQIGVDSKKGEGSTFYFTLPLIQEQKNLKPGTDLIRGV